MSQPTTGQGITQFRHLFRSLVLDPALLYAQLVSVEIVAEVVLREVGQTEDTIYTPLVTLTTLLFQILSDDHSKNQEAYPQHRNQRRGCGFPMARVVFIFSLVTGALLDLAVAPWSGKLTGENALLRGLRGRLRCGDILLGDSYYSSYQEVAACSAWASTW